MAKCGMATTQKHVISNCGGVAAWRLWLTTVTVGKMFYKERNPSNSTGKTIIVPVGRQK